MGKQLSLIVWFLFKIHQTYGCALKKQKGENLPDFLMGAAGEEREGEGAQMSPYLSPYALMKLLLRPCLKLAWAPPHLPHPPDFRRCCLRRT